MEFGQIHFGKIIGQICIEQQQKEEIAGGPFHYLPAENMVGIFAFISRFQIDQCELVNQRFRAIIEHKNMLPKLKLNEKKRRRKEFSIRWKSGIIFGKAMLIMDIFFAINCIISEFFKEDDLVIAAHFLPFAILILFCWTWVNKQDYNVYGFLFFEVAFEALIIPLLLFYTNQIYLHSILFKIYLAFLFPLILFQCHNLYKSQYLYGPP